jgi:hypothetical protein
VVIVTPATSVNFYRPEFEDFLYALIGSDKNNMPLSVLSALARLNVDPWEEAAELMELPKDAATRRLAALIGRLPGGRYLQADPKTSAGRLIELLPRRGSSNAPSPAKAGRYEMPGSTIAFMLICAALGATAIIIALTREPSPDSDRAGQPAYTTSSPPQPTIPNSR